jgi:sec-independent protein translocase protein TatC
MRTTQNPTWNLITLPFRLIGWLFASIFHDIHFFFTEEVDDAPVMDALNKVIDQPQGLLEHVNALRKHLLRSVLVLFTTTAVAAAFYDEIMAFISAPLPGGTESLQIIEVTEPVSAFMRVSLFSGFALAFPYIALELWLFIGPGLSRRTRLFGLFTIPIATLFFLGGVAFAYFVLLPSAVPFLLSIGNFKQEPRVISYIKFVTGMCFWIGAAFEFPLVIFFLARLGVVSSRQLAQQWRLAVVVMAVVSALVTPTVDPVNMSLVMAPMFVLYLFSIFLAFIAQPRAAPAA